MKLGLTSVNLLRNVEGPSAAALARAAEDIGFDSLWALEHVVVPATYASRYPYAEEGKLFKGRSEIDVTDPLLWLSYAAAVTSRIRLGTGILILPERNPVVTAKAVATLDRMSGGRVDLGIGVGWLREEFDALGVPFERRGERTDSYVDALRELWRGDAATYHSDFVDFDGVYCRPTPSQDPLPILVGGHTRASAERAGRLGQGYYPAEVPSVARLVELWEIVTQTAADAGRDPSALRLVTTSWGERGHLDELAGAGVDLVLLQPRPPEQLADAYGELVAAYS